MWILCKLKLFRDSTRQLYPVFCCDTCDSMKGIELMAMNSDPNSIMNMKCIHSKLIDNLSARWPRWDVAWPINPNISANVQCHEVIVNESTKFITLLNEDSFLACVYDRKRKRTSILSTLGNRNKKPLCFRCSVRTCDCFR